MDNFKTWYEKGEKYLSSVKGKNGKPSKFSPTIQYNLISMAFESYAMAICDYHKVLPENHTLTDLLDALDNVITIDKDLRNAIIRHEDVQLICPIIEYSRRDPTETEVLAFRESIERIADIAKNTVSA